MVRGLCRCGTQVQPPFRVHCSKRCNRHAYEQRRRGRKVELRDRVCAKPRCGREFKAYGSLKKYCSRACQMAVAAAKWRRKIKPPPERGECRLMSCRTAFVRNHRGKRKFCSDKCLRRFDYLLHGKRLRGGLRSMRRKAS